MDKRALQQLCLPLRRSQTSLDIVWGTATRILERHGEVLSPAEALRLAIEHMLLARDALGAIQGISQRILERHARTISPARAIRMAQALFDAYKGALVDPLDLDLEASE